jgi:hypothetical protein
VDVHAEYKRLLTLEIKRREAISLRERADRIDATLKRMADYRAMGERLRAVDRFASVGRVTRLSGVMRCFADYRHCSDAELSRISTPQGLRAFYKARYTVSETVNSEGKTLYHIGFKGYPDHQFSTPYMSAMYAQSELEGKLRYHDLR